jgi:hypothetical protein
MLKFFKRIWMGAGYLEGYGHHPGWSTIGIYIVAGGLAGIRNGGLNGFLGGAAITILCIGPFFMIGCYSRAQDYEQDMEQTFKILSKD